MLAIKVTIDDSVSLDSGEFAKGIREKVKDDWAQAILEAYDNMIKTLPPDGEIFDTE